MTDLLNAIIGLLVAIINAFVAIVNAIGQALINFFNAITHMF